MKLIKRRLALIFLTLAITPSAYADGPTITDATLTGTTTNNGIIVDNGGIIEYNKILIPAQGSAYLQGNNFNNRTNFSISTDTHPQTFYMMGGAHYNIVPNPGDGCDPSELWIADHSYGSGFFTHGQAWQWVTWKGKQIDECFELPAPVFTIGTDGSVKSAKACATGFTRVAPNYCLRNTSGSEIAWTDSTGCVAHATGMSFPADPADSDTTGVITIFVAIHWQALSSAGTGLRGNNVTFYNSSGCVPGTKAAISTYSIYEQVPTTAGTVLGEITDHVRVKLASTDTFYAKQLAPGANGFARIVGFTVEGYSD